MVDRAGHAGERKTASPAANRDTAWYPHSLGVDLHLLYAHLLPGLAGPRSVTALSPLAGRGPLPAP